MTQNISNNPALWDDGGRSQAKLAESLVTKLGFDGAAQACQANAWYGVLEFVLLLEDAAPTADE